jgi:alanyl-tRNA synthetase
LQTIKYNIINRIFVKTEIMQSIKIRESFLEFFKSKEHRIVSSAPMVIKNDPTLMFTNAGMNQFKDIFLGDSQAIHDRIANSQKCLRVSGKHNDLDEVGKDTYHHTMFEMLGNWSFGDYFKEEAIEWAWEFLTKKMQLNTDRLYITVFGGSVEENLEADDESRSIWAKHVAPEKILIGNRKDNFWEMGETGPCGPCSEIHIDLRPDQERKNLSGDKLVNENHPLVIEIWNLVFIQFNRKTNGQLVNLPQKHVDTGMGFERLCMALQNKTSNYDTDIFTPIINKIEKLSSKNYGSSEDTDIAMRVIADHLRAVAFSIADGQLPSNVKAGYVIRRILRRAVRYAYSFLDQKEPFMHKLVDTLVKGMGNYFPELAQQQQLIEKVIFEEEQSFLRTLEKGISLLNDIINVTKARQQKLISGLDAFILYDTYGFPFDLTELIVIENDLKIDKNEFDEAMQAQKYRARKAAETDTGDWTVLKQDDVEEFIGYNRTEAEVFITKYREIIKDKKKLYQLVFQITPFYAESGGQVGDTGYIESNGEKTEIIDTKNENNLIVHICKKLPSDINAKFRAVVNLKRRYNIMRNHSATHLMHNALRNVLGEHVEQKGSLVHPDYLRFDFTHFEKMTEEQIRKVEILVNDDIRKNVIVDEKRDIPIDEAKDMGAMALFGEKYGDLVRVIKFGESVELCGGTHVSATGEIGFFKIIHESAIAAGIRRVEAITGEEAEKYIYSKIDELNEINKLFNKPKGSVEAVNSLINENKDIKNQISLLEKEKIKSIKLKLKNAATDFPKFKLIKGIIDVNDIAYLKDIAFQLKGELKGLVCILGAVVNDKPGLCIMIDDTLVTDYNLNAGIIIKKAAALIQGGGGGQAFLATAGGNNKEGIRDAIDLAENIIKEAIV